MTDDPMPLLEALLKRGGGDFMKNPYDQSPVRCRGHRSSGQGRPRGDHGYRGFTPISSLRDARKIVPRMASYGGTG